MAISTAKSLRQQVLYSVFVRQYSPAGTFEGVRQEVKRIHSLGVDIIWFLPIHPIGEIKRKGSLGCPYAIKDYRAVNPEYGTREDFIRLVDAIHREGMKCIIDVVYNHTSPDSVLVKSHPEWFYHKKDGSLGNHIGDWTDIVDLDYSHPELWDYQIETLKQWAKIVDGFRCDTAAFLPLAFWLKAREEVAKVRPDCLWLCESVEPDLIRMLRENNLTGLSDSELFQAFDIGYDYDIYFDYLNAAKKSGSLAAFAAAINHQETIYPDNYVKLRMLENHDRERAASLFKNEKSLQNWTVFSYFQKGMSFIYNGQEVENPVEQSLFEKDPINWMTGKDLSPLLKKLYRLKHNPLFADSAYSVEALNEETLLARHRKNGHSMVGIFSMQGNPARLKTSFADGLYHDYLSGKGIAISGGFLETSGDPLVFAL
jgi:alpha-amylase